MLGFLIHTVALILIATTVLLIGVVPIYAMFFKDDPATLREVDVE